MLVCGASDIGFILDLCLFVLLDLFFCSCLAGFVVFLVYILL